ncbi:MAG: hypothetical protein RLY86_4265 [Pseudomonadota bacterium]|jgi:ATP-dependent DNA helicase RecG
MNAAEILQQLNALDEHPRLEAKKGGGMSEDVLRSVCAFANEPGLGGGWILFGVERGDETPDRRYRVVGVRDLDQLQNDLASQAGSVFNHPIRPQVAAETLDGKPVLVAFIPEQPSASKPIYVKKVGLPKGAYRRITAADVACTDDDLPVLYGQHTMASLDTTPVDAGLAEVDADAVAAYRRVRREVNPDAEELRWDDADLLHALGCLARQGGAERITLAGLVLFGSSKAQRRLIPMQRVDYIRVPGRVWADRPEQPYQTHELRGPLLTLIPRIHDLVLGDLPMAATFASGSVQRTDVPLIPGRVLREGVVNAVMHRSWRIHGPVQIIRYANRLEIANPGYSLKLADQLGETGSRTRNPTIAAVLHDTHFAETKGSGIRIMRELLRGAGLSAPSFDSNRDADSFTATFLFHHFLDAVDTAWVANLGIQDLSADDIRALIFAREKGAVTNADLRDLTHLDTLAASLCLRRLRDRGLLDQRERGSATYYVPSARVVFADLPPLGGHPGNLPAEPDNPLAEPDNLPAEPDNLPTPSGTMPPNTGHAAGPGVMRQGLPPHLLDQVVALKGHASGERLLAVIVALCSWRELTRKELAATLERSPKYLGGHLKSLVGSGRLVPRFPDQPNHPQQAYRAPVTP